MSPEYVGRGIVSLKIDVFSFGVLVLEIVSGKKNYNSYDLEHSLNLIGFVSSIIDPSFSFLFIKENTIRLVEIQFFHI